MPEVFISYARATERLAKRVESGLKAAGFNAWRDDQLPAHRAYSDIIEQKLRGASAVVVLWSKEAAQSQWVRAEADFARNQGKLVQAQLDETLPPLPFNQIQCADLRGWRGHRSHKGWVKLKESVASVAAGEKPQEAQPATARVGLRMNRRVAVAAIALLTLIAGAVFLLPRLMGGGEKSPRVVVLPFESTAGSNESLVAGMWEDTRQALSRNPQLVVLGPNTSEEIARKGGGAARKAADYLLETNVRTAGDRVRVSTSLVRSKDGAQIWSETFDRKLDDVFALQTEVAQQIEGRIRGRLARAGGVLPEHITTSGEVYALYSEARAKLKQRGSAAIAEAYELLQQVVAKDPNFAPGWATLAVAEAFGGGITSPGGFEAPSDPEQLARRAIALAPNLASGHAALGFALNFEGPVAEAALRKAVQLDPNDVETLNWLAIHLGNKGEDDEVLKLYSRAVEIEPLWWPAVVNRLNAMLRSKQNAAVATELERLEKLDAHLWTLARMQVARFGGDSSEVVRLGLAHYQRAMPHERPAIDMLVMPALVQTGHLEEAHKLSGLPPFVLLVWNNDPKAISAIDALGLPPQGFWVAGAGVLPSVSSRVRLNNGRGEEVVELYRSVASSPEEFERATGGPSAFIELAPLVALALRQAGDQEESARLLVRAEAILPRADVEFAPWRQVYLAQIYAIQGRKSDAVELLARARNNGWWPEVPRFMPDLALDPPLATLRSEPGFEKIRRQILEHFAKERAELGPVPLE